MNNYKKNLKCFNNNSSENYFRNQMNNYQEINWIFNKLSIFGIILHQLQKQLEKFYDILRHAIQLNQNIMIIINSQLTLSQMYQFTHILIIQKVVLNNKEIIEFVFKYILNKLANFRKEIFEDIIFENKSSQIQIEIQNLNEKISQSNIKLLVDFIKAVGFYKQNSDVQSIFFTLTILLVQCFENIFQLNTIEYFQKTKDAFQKNFDLKNYLGKIKNIYDQEIALKTLNIIESKCMENIENQFIQILLKEILDYIIDIHDIFEQNQQYLENLYWVFKKSQNIGQLTKLIYQYILTKGQQIIENDSQKIIDELIKLKEHYDEIQEKYFQNDNSLREGLNSALDDVVLKKMNTLTELFSKYLDAKLIKSTKQIKNEQQIGQEIDRALRLFRYFNAKDVFEIFFTQRLTKRIILDLSYSYELEYDVFRKLKEQCGDQYIKKSEEIIEKFLGQKQMNQQFFDYVKQQQIQLPNTEFKLILISTNSWTLPNIKLPRLCEPFGSFQQIYEEFYLKKFDKQKVLWQEQCSNCEIEGCFNNNDKYKFQVSIIQSLILLQFNDQRQISWKDLSLKLQDIGQAEVAKHLISLLKLSETDYPLLKKSNNQKSLQGEDQIFVNMEFQSKRKLIRVNQIQKKETKEDIDLTTAKVLNERQYMIDASIVKIMKREKKLILNSLIEQVVKDLKLPLKMQDIKLQIDILIQREYLERDSKQYNLFHYLA